VASSAAASLANRGARYIKRIAEADGIAPPLPPEAKPYLARARDGSSYVAVRLYPVTLNELRKFSRGFGRPAARMAEWYCVTTWLMNGPPPTRVLRCVMPNVPTGACYRSPNTITN